MKKLGKLQINPEKLMKNEELVTLRGGYDEGGCWTCTVYCPGAPNTFGGGCGESKEWVQNTCNAMWEPDCSCSCV